MTIGEKIKNARLSAGLSQRQLCGTRITRNMLSLIENGAAKPSMDTLSYLAGRLGQPMSYFLEEAYTSNRQLLQLARTQEPVLAIKTLNDYKGPDESLDAEYHYLLALTSLRLARQALRQGKRGYCRDLLKQAQEAGSKTPYYTRELDRERICIAFLLDPNEAVTLETQLLRDESTYLQAKAALDRKEYDHCLHRLASESGDMADLLRAEALFAKQDYENALRFYKKLPDQMQNYSKMEICCRELGDFQQAYHYACLQR